MEARGKTTVGSSLRARSALGQVGADVGRRKAISGEDGAERFELAQGLVERACVQAQASGDVCGRHVAREAIEEPFQRIRAAQDRHLAVLGARKQQSGRLLRRQWNLSESFLLSAGRLHLVAVLRSIPAPVSACPWRPS